MRVIIKGADFSEVSIGKVVKDLSFEVSANINKGVSGFTNWNEENQSVVSEPVYRISGNTVYYGNKSLRLHTDFIEVVGGMTITAKAFDANGVSDIIPNIVCFDENKELFTDATDNTHVVYFNLGSGSLQTINFTIPSDVKYIKIQSGATNYTTIENANVYTGSMPVSQ